MEKGILYKVTGERFVNEAKCSAKSVKEAMPNLPVAIVSDCNIDSQYFDVVKKVDDLNNDNSCNIIEPEDSPFEKTIKLDSDIYVHKPITELFELLDEYDLAIDHSSRKFSEKGDAYPMLNPAIMVYNDCDDVNKVLKNWKKIYWERRNKEAKIRNEMSKNEKYRKRKAEGISNIPSFSKSVYDSNCDYFILPNWISAGRLGYLSQEVKMIHDRPLHDKKEVAEKLNSVDSKRVYYLDPCSVTGSSRVNIFGIPASNKNDNRIKRMMDSIRMNGVKYTLKAMTFDLLSTIYSRNHLKRTIIQDEDK